MGLCAGPERDVDTIVLKNGFELEVESVEVQDKLLLFRGPRGTLYSLRKDLVDLAATKLSDSSQSRFLDSEPGSHSQQTRATARCVLELFGLELLLLQLADVATQLLPTEPFLMTADQGRGRLQRAVMAAYDPEAVGDIVVRRLESRSLTDQLRRAEALLELPLNRQIFEDRLEAEASESFEALQNFSESIEHNPPSLERVALLTTLDRVTRVSIYRELMHLGVQRAFGNRAGIAVEGSDSESLDASIAAAVRAPIGDGDSTRTLWLLYAYRVVDDADLREFVRLWDSETGNWLGDSVLRSIVEALKIAEARLDILLLSTSGGPLR